MFLEMCLEDVRLRVEGFTRRGGVNGFAHSFFLKGLNAFSVPSCDLVVVVESSVLDMLDVSMSAFHVCEMVSVLLSVYLSSNQSVCLVVCRFICASLSDTFVYINTRSIQFNVGSVCIQFYVTDTCRRTQTYAYIYLFFNMYPYLFEVESITTATSQTTKTMVLLRPEPCKPLTS